MRAILILETKTLEMRTKAATTLEIKISETITQGIIILVIATLEIITKETTTVSMTTLVLMMCPMQPSQNRSKKGYRI